MIWDPDPFLFALDGPFPGLRYYGVLVVVGGAVSILVTASIAERDGVRPARVSAMLVLATCAAIVGGHFGHLAFYEPGGLSDPARIIGLGAGQASHGAMAAALLSVWALARGLRDDPRTYLDAAASGGACAVPFYSLGNLMNSELVGRAWDGPWAVYFPRHDCIGIAGRSTGELCEAAVARHPAMLYSAMLGLVLVALVFVLQRRWRQRLPRGAIALIVVLAYSAARFVVEYTKEYQVLDPHTSALTMGHWLSLPFIVGCGLLFVVGRSRSSARRTEP